MLSYNFDLTNYNSLRVHAISREFIEVNSIKCLQKCLSYGGNKFFLGGGFNTLFRDKINRLVIKNSISGKEIISSSDKYIYIKSYSGNNWHDFVQYCVDNNYGGIENLALIPGTVGGAVAQNIAAYGQHIEDVVHQIEVFDFKYNQINIWTPDECEFTYRDSKFKVPENQGRYFIISATFKLCTSPSINTSYWSEKHGSIGNECNNINDIFQRIVYLRRSKFDYMDKYGSAGSFFKNPVVSYSKYMQIKEIIPNIQAFSADRLEYVKNTDAKFVKIAAGQILDYLNFRGHWHDNAGISDGHALVLVTKDGVDFDSIENLSNIMIDKVDKYFGIKLEKEVVTI